MGTAQVMTMEESLSGMTCGEALRFVERTRRQVERMNVLPRPEGKHFDPEEAATLFAMLDKLEADIRELQATP